jgi:predicted Zn-dependent peptidase
MYRKTLLDNSIRIVTERLPSRLISVGIWVDVGSRDEDPSNNGSAHFAEHMFFKGTRTRSARQISQELDMLGGMSNAFTSTEHTCFYATVLDEHLDKATALLADIFLNSLFLQEEVEREREVILQEIAMVEDTPDDRVHELFTTLYWEGHSLANTVLGMKQVVENMTEVKLREYVRSSYLPGRIVVAAAGNVDHEHFSEIWRRSLGEIREGDGNIHQRRAPSVRSEFSCQVVNRPLEQVHMVMGTTGVPANSPDRYKMLALNIILGGNMSSRLFQEIREKRGLAYSVYSYLSSNSDSGYAAIYLGVDPQSLGRSVELIHRELAKIKEGDITAEELSGAVQYAMSGIYLAAENMERRMTSLAKNEYYFGRHLPIEEMVAGLSAVKVDEINELAGALYGGGKIPVAMIGPVTEEQKMEEIIQ